MTNNDTPKAEQLVRDHLEYIKSGLWNDVYGTNADLKTICESYLSLLDQLKIAKEALEFYAKVDNEGKKFLQGFNAKPDTVDENSVANIALSYITI